MKRFAILAHSRSGSNLLTGALGRHPDVKMFWELFHPNPEIRRGLSQRSGVPMIETDADGQTYLESQVYSECWNKQAVGLKLLFIAGAHSPHVTAWDYLEAQKDIFIIHLHRDNLLEALVSHELAHRTGQWFVPVESGEKVATVAPFRVEPRECLNFFWSRTAIRRWAAGAFSNHAYLSLEYSRDLAGNFDNAVTRACQHLGLAPFKAAKELVKQSTRHPRDQLSNYDELKATCVGTPYARFFEES